MVLGTANTAPRLTCIPLLPAGLCAGSIAALAIHLMRPDTPLFLTAALLFPVSLSLQEDHCWLPLATPFPGRQRAP
jgi:hypothetical protein